MNGSPDRQWGRPLQGRESMTEYLRADTENMNHTLKMDKLYVIKIQNISSPKIYTMEKINR